MRAKSPHLYSITQIPVTQSDLSSPGLRARKDLSAECQTLRAEAQALRAEAQFLRAEAQNLGAEAQALRAKARLQPPTRPKFDPKTQPKKRFKNGAK